MSSDEKRIESFEEFWPFYVKEHAKKTTRMFHFVGTTAAVTCAAAGVLLRKKWLVALAPVLGYGPAWVSHFFIEGNKPASFGYPAWSFKADFIMLAKMARGEMDAEVERVLAEDAAKAVNTAKAEAVTTQESRAASGALVN